MKKHILNKSCKVKINEMNMDNLRHGPTYLTESVESSDPDNFYPLLYEEWNKLDDDDLFVKI